MSLKRLRDYSLRMAEAKHKDECPMLTAKEPWFDMWVPIEKADGTVTGFTWRGPKPKWEPPHCDGCNPDSDRALFRQIADEISEHLGDQLALFGGEGK